MDLISLIVDNGGVTIIAAVAIGAILFVYIQPILSGENVTEERIARYKKSPVIAPKRRGRLTPEQRRRQMIEEGLRTAAAHSGKQSDSIETLLVQSGLGWTKRQFTMYGMIFGMVVGIVVFTLLGASAMAAYLGLAAMALSALLLPKRLVMYKRKKRFKAFTDELPNALDIITRGLKSGLHTNECIRTISLESKEPVRSEFGLVCDAQSIGVTLSDAVAKMADRMPTAETNFFSIAVALQSKNGGRLGEALENLSRTLRQRKNMHGEIKALSMEAKASSVIIGSMPFIIITLVYLSSPDYIRPLFGTLAGNIGLCVAAVWMAIGITLISKMSNIKV
jgi:tight adherence protein B